VFLRGGKNGESPETFFQRAPAVEGPPVRGGRGREPAFVERRARTDVRTRSDPECEAASGADGRGGAL